MNGGRGGQPPIPPFGGGRGGSRQPAMGNNFPMMGPNGLPVDLANISPEMIRKEVIPTMVRMGEEAKRCGTISEAEFRNVMAQVMSPLGQDTIYFK